MRILLALDLNDADVAEAYPSDPNRTGWASEWDDLAASVAARLGYDGTGEAIYAGPHDTPVRGRMVAMCDVTGVLPELLDAAEVGADGITPEDARYAVEGSLVTFRQHLDNADHDPDA